MSAYLAKCNKNSTITIQKPTPPAIMDPLKKYKMVTNRHKLMVEFEKEFSIG